MKNLMVKKAVSALVFALFCVTANAQMKLYSNGQLTIGNTAPYGFYKQTIEGLGMYFKCKTSNFFQIDVSPVGTRLASHADQVVFYNTQTSTFNSIQVKDVYNYSDARAKSNIRSLQNGLNCILKLRPVSYSFSDKPTREASLLRKGGDEREIGLLAQEVEKVLPNVVLTDAEGKKLINYTALIPVMIDAIKSIQTEIELLKNKK